MLDKIYNLDKMTVPLELDWRADRILVPTCLHLEHGGVYHVDRATYDGIHASRAVGGFGHRYTVRCSCELDGEQNYNQYWFAYLELYGAIGRWYCDDVDIDKVTVHWNENGVITPLSLRVDGDHDYRVSAIIQKYPMSSRKTDGAGMRYIVRAECAELQDTTTFALMLEEGGEFVGTWFVEDYTKEDYRGYGLDLEGYR